MACLGPPESSCTRSRTSEASALILAIPKRCGRVAFFCAISRFFLLHLQCQGPLGPFGFRWNTPTAEGFFQLQLAEDRLAKRRCPAVLLGNPKCFQMVPVCLHISWQASWHIMTLRAKPECPQGTVLGARFALEILQTAQCTCDRPKDSIQHNAHVIDLRIQSKQNTFFWKPCKNQSRMCIWQSRSLWYSTTFQQKNTAHSEMLIICSVYASPSAWSVLSTLPVGRASDGSSLNFLSLTWNMESSRIVQNWLGETLPTWCVSRVLSKNLKLTAYLFFLRTFWDLSCPESFVLSSDSENDQHEMLLSLPGTLLTSFSKAWCPFSVFDPSAREPPTQFLGLFFSLGHSPRFLLRKRHEASWSIVKHHISRFAHVVKQRYLDEFWKANVWEAVWVAHDSVYPASATQVPCSCPLGLSSIKMALRMVALQH